MNMTTSIWQKEISLELLNTMSKDTMGERIGIQFTHVGPDFIEASMPVDSRTRQPLGLLHGGASAALIETLGSVAATFSVSENEYCVGVEINANHVRSAREGHVVGTARSIHRGSRIQVWQVEIKTPDEKLISTGRITLAVLSKKASDS